MNEINWNEGRDDYRNPFYSSSCGRFIIRRYFLGRSRGWRLWDNKLRGENVRSLLSTCKAIAENRLANAIANKE